MNKDEEFEKQLQAEQEKVRKLTEALTIVLACESNGLFLNKANIEYCRKALKEIQGDISTTKGSNG